MDDSVTLGVRVVCQGTTTTDRKDRLRGIRNEG